MKLALLALTSLLFLGSGPAWHPLPPPAYHIPRYAPTAFSIVDARGVQQTQYEWGKEYNPTQITGRAIADYAKKDFLSFMRQVRWLEANVKYHGDAAVWEYTFPYPPYNMTVPWISAISQGNALVVLTEAYGWTGNERFRTLAADALKAFTLPVSEGGVAWPSGWYEEYARPGGPSTRILNGHLFAVEGLQWYYEQTGNLTAKRLYEKGLAVAKAALPRYDRGDCVAYDRTGKASPGPYGGVVVRQLWHFFEATGDYELYDYGVRWQKGCPR